MKISYFMTERDFVDLNIYNLKNDPNSRYLTVFLRVLIPIALFALLGIFYFIFKIYTLFSIIIAFAISIIWFVSYPILTQYTFKKMILKKIRQSKNTDINEKIDLIIDDEGITKNCSGNISKVLWSNIEKVTVTKDHIFIYVNYSSAFIIPIRELKDEIEKEMLIKYIRKFINFEY
ncbi:YcxB family protein [Desnuesiella massiliensis]|uniref:YcxB family protein n=1 Tax=Desnuesiella massiliensis TaxID=1650662 RepID=UPI0006E3942F|nr:YcxB family protein [Desnuesiella massiliensis]